MSGIEEAKVFLNGRQKHVDNYGMLAKVLFFTNALKAVCGILNEIADVLKNMFFVLQVRLCLEIKTLSWSRAQSNGAARRADVSYFCVPSSGSARCPHRLWLLAQPELQQWLEVVIQVRIFTLELLIFHISTSSPAPQWLKKKKLHSGTNVHFYNGQFWINSAHEKCLFGVKLCNVSLI